MFWAVARGIMQRKEVAVFLVVGISSWFILFLGGSTDMSSQERWREDAGPYPGASANNLFWFVQVTDIHVSYVDNMEVATPLLKFCREMVDVVRPSLVMATGDLTHAKFPGDRYSKQFESEWEEYRKVLRQCNLGSLPWLDIRGNHDNFDVPSLNHHTNYFKKYSLSGHRSRSYSYLHHTKFGDYNFVALDACPSPGPRRPFNFFGIVHKEDLQVLRNLSSPRVNHTIWFSHYPSSIITSPHGTLPQLMSSSVAHLSGHLHTVHGLLHKMYGRHAGGHLELELGDFTGTRRFRLMAMDHDLFSFSDLGLGKWPYILITNPKDARFLSREPTKRMFHSTHVRVLVFGPHKIASAKLFINGNFHGDLQPVQGGALYVSAWEPSQYSRGLHEMVVEVQDITGVSQSSRQTFSLDDTVAPLELISQLVLLYDLRAVLVWLFLLLWISLLVSLVSSWANIGGQWFLPHLVKERRIFYPYLAAVLYYGIGPWFVGEMLTGHYGIVFMHGVYIMSTFLPGSMTYLYGSIQILAVYIPLGVSLNMLLSRRSGRNLSVGIYMWYSLMVLSVTVQFLQVFQLAQPYGPVAILVSPGCTWLVLLNFALLYSAHRIKQRTS